MTEKPRLPQFPIKVTAKATGTVTPKPEEKKEG